MKERKKGKERGFHQSGLMFIKGKKKKSFISPIRWRAGIFDSNTRTDPHSTIY